MQERRPCDGLTRACAVVFDVIMADVRNGLRGVLTLSIGPHVKFDGDVKLLTSECG